jgi:probable FeS assembly SUF system protein SufT
MTVHEDATLQRECKATEIPSGHPVILAAGTAVTITQTLGGNYTVMTDRGQMVRIEAGDADALGKESAAAPQTEPDAGAAGPVDDHLLWDLLKTIYDPEIPVNIVELGLVYECRVAPLADGGNRAEIKFTMTAPGCGMGDVLKADIEGKVSNIPGIREVDAEIVFDPPWTPDRMSDAAKLQLGMT